MRSKRESVQQLMGESKEDEVDVEIPSLRILLWILTGRLPHVQTWHTVRR